MRNFKFWAIASVCAALSIPLGHVVASGIQALATVPAGGTGLQTLTSGGVLLGAGTSPVTFATSADNTQALCGGNPPAFGVCGTSGTTPGYGPIASLPGSCSTNGLQYITTDSPYIFVCNGATYDATVFGYKVVQPNLSNFTALIAGTTDTTHGGIIAYGARGGSGAFYDIAVPGSGAYYIDMAYTASGTDIAPNGNFAFVILPTSSATAACRYLGLGSLGSGQTQAFEVSTTNCATAAGFASSNINLYSLATAPMIWVRMTDDGTTNRTFQVSTNPYQFNTLVTEGRTTQFTTGFVAFSLQLFQLAQSIHILHFNTCMGAPSAACY